MHKGSGGYRIRQAAREGRRQTLLQQGELETTRQYARALGDVFRKEGLLAATKYEIGSTFYSLGKRFDSLLNPRNRKEDTIERRSYILGGTRSRTKRSASLESTAVTSTVIGFLGGLFFLSPNITGNAIVNLNIPGSNIIGAVLLLIGLIGAFFWIRSHKK